MKKITVFFAIWNYFISLFKKEKKTLMSEFEKRGKREVEFSAKPIIPSHNNRKNTRGRFTQYTPSGRAIYHSPKK